jgi:translation initiation factor 4G
MPTEKEKEKRDADQRKEARDAAARAPAEKAAAAAAAAEAAAAAAAAAPPGGEPTKAKVSTAKYDGEAAEEKVKSMINEYMQVADVKEAVLCVKDIQSRALVPAGAYSRQLPSST